MPKQDSDVVETRAKQRESSHRATFERLRSKKKASKEITIDFGDGEELTLAFEAIGASMYDKLLSKNPPTTEQKADGSIYNINTFGPAILSNVCVDPALDQKQWSEIWHSDEWNRGEVMGLFIQAVELCNKGLDIPLSESV